MVLVRHNHPKSLGLKELSCIYIALTFPWMLKNSQLQLHITARRELSSLACVGMSNFNVFRQGLQSQGRSQLLRVEPLSWTGESRRKSDWESGIETVMSLSSSLQFSLTAFAQFKYSFVYSCSRSISMLHACIWTFTLYCASWGQLCLQPTWEQHQEILWDPLLAKVHALPHSMPHSSFWSKVCPWPESQKSDFSQ